MTGTLDGAEVHELVLTGLFGVVEKVIDTSSLMQQGSLAQLKIKILVLKHDAESCKLLQQTPTYQDELQFIVASNERNMFIRNLANSLRGNTLVLFAYVEKHGKILHSLIKDQCNHDNVFFVAGEVEAEDRENIRAIAEQTDNAIIVASYGVFSQGINIKRLHNIIFASPTKSRIRTLQSIGRGLRRGDDKDECRLFDIADDLTYRNKKNYTLKHLIERVKMYNTESFPYELHNIELKRG
jgi:superfamily II DNA or RNA helicase